MLGQLSPVACWNKDISNQPQSILKAFASKLLGFSEVIVG